LARQGRKLAGKDRFLPELEELEARLTPSPWPFAAPGWDQGRFLDPQELGRQDGGAAAPAISPQLAEAVFAQDAVSEARLERWACDYIQDYVLKSVHNYARQYGHQLPDADDIVQQTFLEWREHVGAADGVYANLLNPDSHEKNVLRRTVMQVIGRASYAHSKQLRTAELPSDVAASASLLEQDWREAQVDWASSMSKLSPRQRQVLELRADGKTFEQIGAEMGLKKTPAYDLYCAAVSQLRELYGHGDAC
jgi:RNA polymerase sigma factor (sigma-70 family)